MAKSETPRDPLAAYYEQFKRKPEQPVKPSLAARLGRLVGTLAAALLTAAGNLIADTLTWFIYCAVFGGVAWVALWGAQLDVPWRYPFFAAMLLRVFILAVKHAWTFQTERETDLSK